MPPKVDINDPVALEVLRQAQEHGDQGVLRLQQGVDAALQDVVRQLRELQIQQANGAAGPRLPAVDPAEAETLRVRIAESERHMLLRPSGEPEPGARLPFVERERDGAHGGVQLAGQLGNIMNSSTTKLYWLEQLRRVGQLQLQAKDVFG